MAAISVQGKPGPVPCHQLWGEGVGGVASLATRNWSLLSAEGGSRPGLSSPSSQCGAIWLPVPTSLPFFLLPTSAQTLSSFT